MTQLTPFYLHSMAQVCAGTSSVISRLAWSPLHHRVHESTSTKYTMLMWTVAKMIHTYIHESTLLCSHIQWHCEGTTTWWDRRLCPIAAVYLHNIIIHTSTENANMKLKAVNVCSDFKQEASNKHCNPGKHSQHRNFCNLVTRVKMISRQSTVRVITMTTKATVVTLLTKVAINAYELRHCHPYTCHEVINGERSYSCTYS